MSSVHVMSCVHVVVTLVIVAAAVATVVVTAEGLSLLHFYSRPVHTACSCILLVRAYYLFVHTTCYLLSYSA